MKMNDVIGGPLVRVDLSLCRLTTPSPPLPSSEDVGLKFLSTKNVVIYIENLYRRVEFC
jgi:hypothetical protein